MKQLIFICHKDHLISNSIGFLVKLFKSKFEVEVIPYDVGINYIEIIIKTYPKAICVLLQTEFLAPWLLASGKKVVIFPMYDGCSNAPLNYFKVLDDAYLFNFSKTLHKKCVEAGVVSYPINYFPQEEEKYISHTKKERMFFWLRRPNGVLSESNVERFFSPFIEKLHIHNRPDEQHISKAIHIQTDSFRSTSNWFENKEDLIHLIKTSKYYLAPRESEGIGMAFLEAMAMGCIVFANNNSTHDQYIHNGHNGFLIDFDSEDDELIKAQIADAFEVINSGKPIGKNAHQYILENRYIWEEQSLKILDILHSLYFAKESKSYSIFTRVIAYLLAKVYYKSHLFYFAFIAIIEPILEPKGSKIKNNYLNNFLKRFYRLFKSSRK